MNLSLFEHALLAIAAQVIIGLLTGKWWAGAAAASSYFVGREIAQAEYRWIEQFGDGLRANMPWHAVFDHRVWQKADQIADWLGPVVATATLAVLADFIRKRHDKPPATLP
ncbi:MAG: hypothetical protein EAY70_07785 [Sphingomonadales bacterium]|nr:MAG: hypothetical protein EAY70_07785 [Sphingomonadales bacterium]